MVVSLVASFGWLVETWEGELFSSTLTTKTAADQRRKLDPSSKNNCCQRIRDHLVGGWLSYRQCELNSVLLTLCTSYSVNHRTEEVIDWPHFDRLVRTHYQPTRIRTRTRTLCHGNDGIDTEQCFEVVVAIMFVLSR